MVALLDSVTVAGFLDRDDALHPAADARMLDRAVAERAADLRSRPPALKMLDVLILATADVAHADVVVTGDERFSAVDIGPRVELLLAS